MPLIYVTGVETAGKSTVCKELQKRGYEAHDIDGEIAHYYHKASSKKSERIPLAIKRTEEWYDQHAYTMDRARVEELKLKSKTKPIFLCGTTRNDDVVLDLFDLVIYLQLDDATLKQRLDIRSPNEFGNASHERAKILGWQASSEEAYRRLGATIFDATQPVAKVVAQILKVAKS